MDNEKEPMFIQIVTGVYDWYSEKHRQKYTSHCLYGLDEYGIVWKYIVPIHQWKMLKELEKDYSLSPFEEYS